MDKGIVELGFREAEAITQRYATTFYAASKLLPRQKRFAAYAIYAICRLSDESVDAVCNSSAQGSLFCIKENIEAAYTDTHTDNCLLAAFKSTIKHYAIPKAYFDELLAGMQMDLEKNRYYTYNELSKYCYHVAGVVGLLMVKILGSTHTVTHRYAINLGMAMQLTNILRDIKEDFQRGRLYLPWDEMKTFEVNEDDIAYGRVSPRFIKLMKFQIQRARNYFKDAERGIPFIADVRSRLVVTLMKDMYAGILDAIERNNYDVFSTRAFVNAFNRKRIIAATILKGNYLWKST
ncbi:MAG: phytoene/squalene synthase family protein [Candidatus Omnitrophica bacterium]|nr:phytoene/squalene synthase family protein [Candidatus Omnitrophota bacterium]